jgi:hypothetical protein
MHWLRLALDQIQSGGGHTPLYANQKGDPDWDYLAKIVLVGHEYTHPQIWGLFLVLSHPTTDVVAAGRQESLPS